MPNQRKSRPVRRSSGSGDVFIPVIIILLGITILSLLIAFVWQKWQDKYDPDYLYPDSRPSSSQSDPLRRPLSRLRRRRARPSRSRQLYSSVSRCPKANG